MPDATSIHPNQVIGFVFAFSEQDMVANGVEVSGMALVQILQGRLIAGELETVCVPLFPSVHALFHKSYSSQADISFMLWNGIIKACQLILTRQLCQQASSQGISFCLKRSPPVHFDPWMLHFLRDFIVARTENLAIHSFHQHLKQIVLRKGGIVHAYPWVISLQWI